MWKKKKMHEFSVRKCERLIIVGIRRTIRRLKKFKRKVIR